MRMWVILRLSWENKAQGQQGRSSSLSLTNPALSLLRKFTHPSHTLVLPPFTTVPLQSPHRVPAYHTSFTRYYLGEVCSAFGYWYRLLSKPYCAQNTSDLILILFNLLTVFWLQTMFCTQVKNTLNSLGMMWHIILGSFPIHTAQYYASKGIMTFILSATESPNNRV